MDLQFCVVHSQESAGKLKVVSFLQDYQGGRDFNSLKKFAEENLGPFLGLHSTRRIPKVRKVLEEQLRPGGAIEPVDL